MRSASLLVILGIVLGFVWPSQSFASQVYFGALAPTVGVGSTFEIGVFLDSQQERINAVEGEIVFPSDLLVLNDIRTGESVISLWIEEPLSTDPGVVRFQGITPGGFNGERGQLFTLVFTTQAPGTAVVTSSDERVLLHDGAGTQARFERAPLTLTISEALAPAASPVLDDQDPPEAFAPEIVRDSSVNDGVPTLVFTTSDKGVGIARYEVRMQYPWTNVRRFFTSSTWQEAQSPYALDRASMQQRIFVKAVDRNGNERVERVEPMRSTPILEHVIFYGILLVTLFTSVVLGRRNVRVWRRSKR